jgi:hypothetical protein
MRIPHKIAACIATRLHMTYDLPVGPTHLAKAVVIEPLPVPDSTTMCPARGNMHMCIIQAC